MSMFDDYMGDLFAGGSGSQQPSSAPAGSEESGPAPTADTSAVPASQPAQAAAAQPPAAAAPARRPSAFDSAMSTLTNGNTPHWLTRTGQVIGALGTLAGVQPPAPQTAGLPNLQSLVGQRYGASPAPAAGAYAPTPASAPQVAPVPAGQPRQSGPGQQNATQTTALQRLLGALGIGAY